jgi:predicted amidophosphoribosyltransferase
VKDRVCRTCEVGWKSNDELCWCCEEPGEEAVMESLKRPTWVHRSWIGWTPPALQPPAPDDIADYVGLLGG